MELKEQIVKSNSQQKSIIELISLKEKTSNQTQQIKGSDTKLKDEIKQAVESTRLRLSQCNLSELPAPFLPKTLTRYRHEYFLPTKQEITNHLNRKDNQGFQAGMKILLDFVSTFDSELVDHYLQQLREPYIDKIFNENYALNTIDFKKVQKDQKLKSYIQNLINNTSQWLIQIQKSQDLFERIQLYFDIKTPIIIQKAKTEGAQINKDRTFTEKISSFIKNISTFILRKSAKIIQSSLFSTMAPSAFILTLAIISGSATLPWQSVINGQLLITPIIALTIPFVLEGLASTIERSELIKQLQDESQVLQQISESIEKFNQQVQATILLCCKAQKREEFQKQKLNLIRYVSILTENLSSLPSFNEETMQELRERTQAYFKKYSQIQEGQWTIVIPSEQLQAYQPENSRLK